MAGVRGERSEKSYVRAGELARAAGVSTDTLRHYERKGVLGAARRPANGYREYPPEALGRVLLVRRALAFGFTLGEWDGRPAGAADGARAGLLESLPGRGTRPGEEQSPRAPLRRGGKRLKRRGTDDEED